MKQNNYCRYGANCRKNQHGNCPFRHRKDELASKDNHKSSAKTYYRERSRSLDQDKNRKKHRDHKSKYYEVERRQQSDYKRQSSKYKYQKYQEKTKYEQKSQQTDYYGNNQHYSNSNNRSSHRPSTQLLPYERDFTKFCRSYHLQDMCDDKDHCNKLHGFLFKNNQRLRRRIFKKSEKFTKDVKLSLSVNNQTQTINYITKNKKQVTFYKYTPAINELQEITTNTLQNNSTPQNQYFGCEGATLYFSFTNEDSLSDLTCFELSTQDCFSIKNAHLKDVTGMVHLNKQNIITTSLDGTIKIWNFDKANYKLAYDDDKSLEFKNHYNPQDKKMELYFIEKPFWGQKQLVCVGTSDSRLLVFINEHPLSFTQIIVSQSQLKIMKMKKIINKTNESFQILLLAHSKDKSEIYKITIDGVNQIKKEKLIELETIEGRRINTFQSHQELLFISYGTEIIIYEMSEKMDIIGGIVHHSPIKSLTLTECYLKTTALSIYVLGVIQGASSSEKKDGLLSFYFIR